VLSPEVVGETGRWSVDRLDFAVDTSLGLPIRGHFDRVGGSYEVGPDGTRIEVEVDPTSVDVGNGIWDGLLRPDQSEVRFRSTRVDETGDATVHVEGLIEASGRTEPVAFDAAVSEVDDGLRLAAVVELDRQRLGTSADRFAVLLPATVHVSMHLSGG
jgi:polyisoprenoid-binding protein YceI